MVRIRLRRVGAKKKPTYRVVVANQRDARNGRFIETIGTYNPLTDPETVDIKADRAAYWISKGAQPSDAVARLLKKLGVLDENGKLAYVPEPEAEPVEAGETATAADAVVTEEAPETADASA